MKDESLDVRMRELGWRRPLDEAEREQLRAWLAGHPERAADANAEVALSELLARLPDVPVATNFTSRVIQAVEADVRSQARAKAGRPGWIRWRWMPLWLPRTAAVAVVLGTAAFSYHEFKSARQAQLVSSLSVISEVAPLPGPEILTNFDAICVLSKSPPADVELLHAFTEL
jgi:anti-sigma factor RsiW